MVQQVAMPEWAELDRSSSLRGARGIDGYQARRAVREREGFDYSRSIAVRQELIDSKHKEGLIPNQ